MENVKLDRERFHKRVKRLAAAWTWPLDALVLVTGKSSNDAQECKAVAMQQWLLGLEFPETIIALLRTGRAVFFTSAKKLEYLREIQNDEVQLMARAPGAEVDTAQLEGFAGAIRGGKEKAVVGMLLKEKHVGPFAEAVARAFPTLAGLQVVECREEIASLLAPKEEDELALVKQSARCAHLMLQNVCLRKLEDIIDKDLRQKNSEVCAELEQEMDNGELMNKWRQKHNIDPAEMDLVYTSLQSGRQFELRPAVSPTDEIVPMQGTYLLSVGTRYTEYAACLSRTLFVDPTAIQKQAYSLILEIQQLVVARLQPGALFKDVYLAAKAVVQQKQPALLDRFVKNVGFVIGLEFRDPQLILSEKSERKVVPGMVFCVSIGFSETAAPQWAAWLADTVVVPGAGGPCVVLTSECSSRATDVMYELDENAPQETAEVPAPPAPVLPAKEAPAKAAKVKDKAAAASAPQRKPPAPPPAPEKRHPIPAKVDDKRKHSKRSPVRETRPPVDLSARHSNVLMQSRTRSKNEQTKRDMSAQARMEERQMELRTKKLEELRARFSGKASRGVDDDRGTSKKLTAYKAYRSSDDMPADARPYRLQMDANAEALLVPITGAIVPFHVRTIKNMSRSSVEGKEFLRVNFFIPGQGKAAEEFPEVNGRRVYIKELSFRSLSKDNFDAVLRGFKEAQKRMKQREVEGEVRRSSSKGGAAEALQPLRAGAFPCIRDVSMRPNFGSSARRTTGTLEAHVNGFRFSIKGGAEKIDVLYSQVQEAIFEPCQEGSLIVLIHLHLKELIMVGKKKSQDLQFFTEVAALTEDLSMRRNASAHDPDEILEEQREREMKERLNKIFHEFAKKVEALNTCPLTFDMPLKELQFNGVPHKQVVTLCPCRRSLVSLQEWPPFCLDLADVDIVVFERLIISLREFDIVFVKKDYDQLPVRITTIPSNQLDKIKAWLAQIEVVWYSCGMNMQWQLVMKEITKDLNSFVENGGWEQWFGSTGGDSEGESGAEDPDDGESDYKEDDDEPEEEDDDDLGGDDGESDFSADPDDEESDPASEDEEDGLSWDELEKEAERSDRKRGSRDSGGASNTVRSEAPAKRRKR